MNIAVPKTHSEAPKSPSTNLLRATSLAARPPMPAKTSDARYAKFVADTGGSDAVELDALEPPVLQQIVKDAVKDEIDQEAWNNRLKEIKENKEKIQKFLEDRGIDWATEWEDE